ncbi:MAG: ScpA family protein [Pseudomonadota bacterium]
MTTVDNQQRICVENQQQKENAKLYGKVISELPQDLYIPPNALEVFLEAFEGPLDLLLYLIKKNNVDIIDIPIAKITAQYIAYIDLMKQLNLELAGEYLLMAAMLAEIKSRLLLPRPTEEEDENDPRAELIRRLQEYERFKKAAEELRQFPLIGRDTFLAQAQAPSSIVFEKPKPQLALHDLIIAFREVMTRVEMYKHHRVIAEPLSVRERMSNILLTIQQKKFVPFNDLFVISEGRHGVIVTFIAILELLKNMTIELIQTEPFAPIHIQQKVDKHVY